MSVLDAEYLKAADGQRSAGLRTVRTVDAFEQAVAAIPQIQLAQRLFGDPDYLVRVVTRDLPAFQAIYDDELATLPGVHACAPPSS